MTIARGRARGDAVPAILEKPHTSQTAKEEGMITLRESGLEKLRSGVTTVDEVRRETTVY